MKAITYDNPMISRNKVVNKRFFTPIHYHDSYELYYLLSGRTMFYIGDEIFHVESGNFVLVPPNVLHKTDSDDCRNNERILLTFNTPFPEGDYTAIVNNLSIRKHILIPQKKIGRLEKLLYGIEAEYGKKDKHYETIINLYTLELLTLLDRYGTEGNVTLSANSLLIKQISEYISQNYGTDITLDFLCNKFGISKSHLSRQFKKFCGIGISDFLNCVRITNAEILLSETTLSITEVAERCGFGNSSYFTAVFKKLKGVTPLKYAKKNS